MKRNNQSETEMATREPARRSQPKVKAQPQSLAFYLILGAALFAFMQTFWLLAPILLSFLLILLITLAVNPVISWMRGLRGGRGLPTGLILIGLFLTIALTGWGFFGPVSASLGTVSERIPHYWERLQKPLIKLEQQAVSSEKKLQAEVSTEIAQEEAVSGEVETEPAALPKPEREPEQEPELEPASGSVRSSISQMLIAVAGGFAEMAFNAAQLLVVLVTVFFGVTYMLLNPRPIFRAMFSLIPGRHHDQALAIARRIATFVPQWAGATLVGMASIGLLVFLLMWPIFGFTDALVLGIIAGVLEVIPFLGPLLSVVPALLLALGQGGMAPVWVVLAYLAVQALENNVILPTVMARGMNLHPLAVIFSVLICVAAFGVLGVLVAAPVVAIVTIFHDELYRKRFLPTVTDADLDRLARHALREKSFVAK
jgi:predicted PurR-regulated permease PerM